MLVAAILFRKWGRQFAAAAGFVLLAGTLTCQLALMSGHAAEEFVEELGLDSNPAAHETLEEHEEAGEAVRNLFAALTLLYWGYLAFTGLTARKPTLPADSAVLAAFAALTAIAAAALLNAAHLGGELVHKHGILAPMDKEAAAAASEAAGLADESGAGGSEDEGDHD